MYRPNFFPFGPYKTRNTINALLLAAEQKIINVINKQKIKHTVL